MSQCTDIDAALKRLENKINEQNKAIADLKKKQEQCCSSKSNTQNPKNNQTDLTAILKRLAKAEKDILELGGIVKEVIDDIKEILDSLTEHNGTTQESQNIFSFVFDLFLGGE
ncbi:hypothetical protein I8748_16510 [Nostoc sp. CENA67]|uniref:Uncharacterized protein n=1 Tax=Amazonocrinis nigriterrae CENA67 TaxID=2794033 RepID=A0A8J7HWT1_9NOST|nr:hypothetical protein [Amazonocrinis nigriterrae]MBH8563774.1 hypothetical protein [Amazonocrinis nigriterrae CENA67]